MMPRIPRTLTGQALAILVLGLVISHAIGFAIYSLDRHDVVATTEATDFAERVAGVIMLLRKLPQPWQQDVIRGSDSRAFRVSLAYEPAPETGDLDSDVANEVKLFLEEQFPDWDPGRIRVHLGEHRATPEAPLAASAFAANAPGVSRENVSSQDQNDLLFVSMQLNNGRWLNFVGPIRRIEQNLPRSAGAYVLSVAVGVGLVAVWLVFRVTGPLSTFADAANRLGRNLRAEPLPETGPFEVAQASRALNEMQQRLRRLVENRTLMLAAISHDLRTPVTLLRLRAELMEDPEEQARVLETLDDMESMITAVLDFSKGSFSDEAQRHVDLSALLQSLCDDMVDAGMPTAFEATRQVLLSCRRAALKRAFSNLIDNAVKYGGIARVRLDDDTDSIVVTIEDDGPGVDPQHLEQIFTPFFRIDSSRSRGSGGVGLGLTIAQAIVQGHGGEIGVSNREQGGLAIRVTLPK